MKLSNRLSLKCACLAMPLVSIALLGCGRSSKSSKLTTEEPQTAVDTRHQSPRGSVTSQPFTAVSKSGQATLFNALNAASIGIDFVHQWSPPQEQFMEIRSYASTAGIAIGDYDSDGRPDLFLASQTDGGKLYRNLGDWKFQDVTSAANLTVKGMWATGVAFADIDNDSHLDIALCGFNCSNRVFINQGNGTFQEKSKKLRLDYLGASTMMSFADYDRDGDLDVYLLTNRLPPQKRQTGRAKKVNGKVVVPDHLLEETGVMNLPSGEFHFMPAGQFDYMFRNDGDFFTDVTKAAGLDQRNHHGLSATWWDPNDDGWPDLFVSNDFAWPDHHFVHNGNKSSPAFSDEVREAMPHVPWFSMGSDVGDFNNDGRLDLIATDMSPTSHYRSKLTMGDMSSFAWFLDHADPKQYMRNAVFLNTGTPRFQEVAQMTGVANSNWTWSVRAEDFDCDGLTDLFMTTGMTRDFENADLTDELNQLQLSARSHGDKVAIASRFWQEKPQLKEQNLAFRNRGDLQFEQVGREWGFDTKTVGFGCATGDLDGDGDQDIVVNNFLAQPSIYRNLAAEQSSGANNRIKVELRGRQSNAFGIGSRVDLRCGDLSQTKYLTSARGYMSTSEPALYFGLNDHLTAAAMTIRWPSGIRQVVKDVAANRVYKIVEPETTTPPEGQPNRSTPMFIETDIVKGIRHREQPFDDFARQPLLPNRLSQLGPGIAWGDVNGDGTEDLFIGGARGEPGRPHLRRDGRFLIYPKQLQAFIADSEYEDMGALFFDADSDGDLDLYVVSGGVECEPKSKLLRDRLYINNGNGQFDRASDSALPDICSSGSCVVGADFDRDGDVDLFVGGRTVPGKYPTTPVSYLLENQSEHGIARFADVTDDKCPEVRQTGMVTGAIWADVNDDRWNDLLVTHEWGPVKLFLNNKGVMADATPEAGLSNRKGWFNGITAGDIDHDGDIDFVVTNCGQNTKYRASVENPIEIFYGDFDGSDQKRIVEAIHKENRLLPLRGKSCSQNAMPFLRAKFPTYHEFALQSVDGIYSQSSLDDALRFDVNELDSGILTNDGQGRFSWQSLPRITQIAPGFGVGLADFNCDGHLDMVMAQNSFSPQRETGRMDGGVGQLLVGDGTGSFRPVEPHDSGIVVPGDAKALAITDLNVDGRPDVVFSVNNGPLRAFINQIDVPVEPLTIHLRGIPGNVNGAGARIRVSGLDDRVQVSEVYAGSGYLSQSTSSRTFAGEFNEGSEIRVQWPNGAESTLAITDARNLTISQTAE